MRRLPAGCPWTAPGLGTVTADGRATDGTMPDRRDGGQVKGRAMMPDEPTTGSAPTPERFISRRTLIAGAGAGATVMAFGGLAALTRGDSATAQDEATPSAEEVAESPKPPASPEASPTADLPAV